MSTTGVSSAGSRELRRYLRDLAALTALPALWAGADRRQIAESLAEVLLKVFHPEFVYVRLKGPKGEQTIEVARPRQGPDTPERQEAIRRALEPSLGGDTVAAGVVGLSHPIAVGSVQAAVMPIGYEHEFGVLAVGDGQPHFPTEEDRLLLSAAANQAAVVLQRQQAEKAQALLAAIVASSEDAIVSKTLGGIITSWNTAAERLFGYTPDEMIGRSITLIIPPERRHEEDMILERLSRGERIEHYETVRRSKEGKPVDISLTISPIRDGTGRIVGASKVARDISARKQAEKALRQSEERFRFLAEAIPSIIWTAAPDGTITYVNQRWLEYCGITAEQNARSWPELILHPDDHERCVALWTKHLREGQPYEIEVRNRRHDGAYRWFVTRAVPYKDEGGQVVCWFGVTTDIHDQKDLAETLRQADRKKDEFLAILAHELRNPLAPIRNAVQILRVKGPPLPELQWAREVIIRQVEQMTRLVDDLLDVSRIRTGKIGLRKEWVDLANVVGTAVEASRPLVEKWGHVLTVTLPPEPVRLEVDPARLAQVLLNLLNNAAKYTNQGGRIWLTVERTPEAVLIRVKDTGVGIPPEMLPRVFDMFTQVDRSVERSQGGLGIGLTLVQRLVEMHGGTVQAYSAGPGTGSEFVVRLPVVGQTDGRPSVCPAGNGEGATTPPKHRILVVDDNRDGADSLAVLLRMMGHQVHTAYDGLEAVGAATVLQPDVILLDIGLPKLNGFEAARRIRQERGDGVVLIAVTGWGQQEDRRRSREAGFDHHLTKPVEIDTLEQLLAETGPVEPKHRPTASERG